MPASELTRMKSAEIPAVARVSAQPMKSSNGLKKMPPPTPTKPDSSPMAPPSTSATGRGGECGVAAVLSRVPAPLVVIRPLVETQRARTLLNYFPNAKALFVYRHYADVASADLLKFGPRNAIDNIRPIATGNTHDWRSASTTAAVRARVAAFFSDTMSPNDAAALFWYARNQLYYDLELAAHREAMLCRYEDLISEPAAVMRRIYEFADITCPDLSHTRQLSAGPSTSTEKLELLPEVRALCEQLQARLDAQYELQSRMPVIATAEPETCVPRLQSAALQ